MQLRFLNLVLTVYESGRALPLLSSYPGLQGRSESKEDIPGLRSRGPLTKAIEATEVATTTQPTRWPEQDIADTKGTARQMKH